MIDGVPSRSEMQGAEENTPSLEHLIETEDLGLDVLHPGGVAMTLELARLCHVGRDTRASMSRAEQAAGRTVMMVGDGVKTRRLWAEPI
jgi:hypothetical protein